MREATKEDIMNMYLSIQEVICAYIVNQKEVEKARNNKKSMLKAYQFRDSDLQNAFLNCLNECRGIMQELNIEY